MMLMSNPIVVPSLHVIVRLETVIVLQPGPKSYEKDTASDGDVVATSSTAAAQAKTRNARVEISRVCMSSPLRRLCTAARGWRMRHDPQNGPIPSNAPSRAPRLGQAPATACSGHGGHALVDCDMFAEREFRQRGKSIQFVFAMLRRAQ